MPAQANSGEQETGRGHAPGALQIGPIEAQVAQRQQHHEERPRASSHPDAVAQTAQERRPGCRVRAGLRPLDGDPGARDLPFPRGHFHQQLGVGDLGMRPPPRAPLVERAYRKVLRRGLGKARHVQPGGTEHGLRRDGCGKGGCGVRHRREIAEVAVAIQDDGHHPRGERRRIGGGYHAIRPGIERGKALPVEGNDGRLGGVPCVPVPGLGEAHQIGGGRRGAPARCGCRRACGYNRSSRRRLARGAPARPASDPGWRGRWRCGVREWGSARAGRRPSARGRPAPTCAACLRRRRPPPPFPATASRRRPAPPPAGRRRAAPRPRPGRRPAVSPDRDPGSGGSPSPPPGRYRRPRWSCW